LLIKKVSEIIITPEPFDLRAGVTVDNIALFVLEVPRDYDEDVPFAYPDFLFDLSLDSPHPGYAVETADSDMVCPHHQFGTPEHLAVSFLGKFNPDDLIARRHARFLVCQYNLSSSLSARFFRGQSLAGEKI
jgi:hypothetical protein